MRYDVETDSRAPLDDDAGRAGWVVVALTVVGAALRVVLARQDLFGDELATYWIVSTRGFSGVVDTVATNAEITPPLSFVLSWLTTRIGLAPELVRLPALIAGIASIPLVYAVGRRTVGRPAALLAAALTTLSPFMTFYSAEARGYGVLMALLLLSTLALLLAIEHNGPRWWVLYAVCACLAAYTHYTGVFVLAGQFAWAAWRHPRARRPLLLASGVAALLYLPWLPSLRGDLDSPTTDILGVLSPFDLESARVALGHWIIGFPYPLQSLSDLPGTPMLVLLTASMGIGACGLFTERAPMDEPRSGSRAGVMLVVLLGLATPIGAAVQSALSTDVFTTRSFAASWPYLALAVAALLTAGRPVLRGLATTLALAAFVVASGLMLHSDVRRPDFARLAEFADEHPGAVILNGAAFTPGPLTNFELEGSTTDAQVFRLFAPEQMKTPFTLQDKRPDPTEVSARGVAAADGGPIIFIGRVPLPPAMQALVERLPDGYVRTDTKVVQGIFDVQAIVYEQSAPA
jgi:Dolichyl-phosphate-mannose-protein mannosyltransferase